MSEITAISAPQPIIVVRRRAAPHGDGHHGGGWKIAYADFMTAMMAFFLVMWLVNSTDQKTIVQVAAYFNPMRLSDKIPSARGLHEGTLSMPEGDKLPGGQVGRESKEDTKNGTKEKKTESKREARKHAEHERDLFADPIKTLDKLAATVTDISPPLNASTSQTGERQAGDSVPDPFDRNTTSSTARPGGGLSEQPNQVTAETPQPKRDASQEQQSPAAALVAAISKELQVVIAKFHGEGPKINVSVTAEGVLISLSDNAKFGMFEVASAEPQPELVVLMSKVAELLRVSEGSIVVRGHTDGRPFRTATYDNWRLSSARAQMAFYMLVRGGIPESRVERVEGYADRKPLNVADTYAPENRRIDILLRRNQ